MTGASRTIEFIFFIIIIETICKTVCITHGSNGDRCLSGDKTSIKYTLRNFQTESSKTRGERVTIETMNMSCDIYGMIFKKYIEQKLLKFPLCSSFFFHEYAVSHKKKKICVNKFSGCNFDGHRCKTDDWHSIVYASHELLALSTQISATFGNRMFFFLHWNLLKICWWLEKTALFERSFFFRFFWTIPFAWGLLLDRFRLSELMEKRFLLRREILRKQIIEKNGK